MRIEMNVFDDGKECRIEVRRFGSESNGAYQTADSLPEAKRLAVEWAAREAREQLSSLDIGRYAGRRWEVSEDRMGKPLNFVYR
jgi:hypothetical protein